MEDNEVYAKSLQAFIEAHFPEIKEVRTFRIGEMCLMELHRNPGMIIMDYFLNSKYEEAHNGLEIIKRIKSEKPQTSIIVLSAQGKFDVITAAIKQYDCSYVQKDKNSFQSVELLIREFLNQKKSATLQPWA